MITLTPAERRALRARAHALHPVVAVGDKGLTPAVLREIESSLDAHELIKVRIAEADRETRDEMLLRICDDVDAAPVQHIGKILIIYRPAADKDPGKPKRAKSKQGGRTRTRNSRAAD